MLCVSLAAGAILLCGVLLVLLMRYQHTSAVRPQDQYVGQIPAFYSTVDADGDGVDDQTDMLDNALAYVETRPKYKSRYYQTGYPDDGYGVCTDVVAFALKNAGYDLQALVDADIREHPQWYDIQQPDANIDFRRVRNLKVFFAHHAAALTTDVSRTEEWQGGDLVIFEKHIGIVSDRRNPGRCALCDPSQQSLAGGLRTGHSGETHRHRGPLPDLGITRRKRRPRRVVDAT